MAIGILAMVSSFAGVIFKVSIDSQRTGLANAKIMRKLRAITDQLNSDFKGIRRDAPMAIQFRRDGGTRRDSIAFFANGDFQSVRQYWYEKSDGNPALRTVVGNVASIYYGQASGPTDPNILARKQKILTSDTSLMNEPLLSDADEFLIDSLAVWRVGLDDVSFPDWVASLFVDPHSEAGLPLYMTEDVADFMIQVWDPLSATLWFPHDVDGIFGFFYNIPGGLVIDDWSDESASWPRALKFTFTLYDSKGIIKDGRTFTHIVYLGD